MTFLTQMEQKTHLVLYACGPHAMLAAVSRIAAEHSIPCYVSMEERMACGLGACMGCSVPMKAGGYKRVCKEGPVFDSREIDVGGAGDGEVEKVIRCGFQMRIAE